MTNKQNQNSGDDEEKNPSTATSEIVKTDDKRVGPAFTPGPWVFTEGYEGDETVWAVHTDEEGPWLIARMEAACDENNLPSGVEDRANALLVAAAPDLHAAASFALSVLSVYPMELSERMAIEKLTAAIALANGQVTNTDASSGTT